MGALSPILSSFHSSDLSKGTVSHISTFIGFVPNIVYLYSVCLLLPICGGEAKTVRVLVLLWLPGSPAKTTDRAPVTVVIGILMTIVTVTAVTMTVVTVVTA